jgi:hypothetical protein
MLRWFITVFTLHFFLCVGVSAVGKSAPIAPIPHGSAGSTALASAKAAAAQQAAAGDTLAPQAQSAAQATSDDSEPEALALSHALFDDADDLPDDVNLLRALVSRSSASYPPLQWAEAKAASHAPATPRKPPRSALTA